jgi:hypothetical protein
MKRAVPRPVGDLLSSALPQIEDRLLEFRIRRDWPSIVGREVARRARPDGFAAGTLRVVVDNSPWLHELTLREADLTRQVGRVYPSVKALRLTLGTLEKDTAGPGSAPLRPLPLTAADRADIDAAAAAIPDPGLADAARRLLTTARRFPRVQTGSRGAV